MRERSGFISSGSAKGNKHPIGTIGRIRQKESQRGVWVRRSRGGPRAFGRRSKNHSLGLRWSLIFSIGALVVILSIFTFWAIRSRQVTGDEGYVSYQFSGTTPVIEPMPENDVKQLIKAALTCRDPNQVATFFHLGETTPQQVLKFLSEHVTKGPESIDPYWLGMLSSRSLVLDIGVIELGDATRSDPRLLILTPDPNQQWKLDFDAFARTTTPSWPEILSNPTQGGIARVTLRTDNYFNGPFTEQEWICLRLSSPDLDKDIYGYCKRGSLQANAILSLAEKGSLQSGGVQFKMASDIRATFEIRQPEGALPGQFEITRVMGEDWIVSKEPYEDFVRQSREMLLPPNSVDGPNP